MSTRNFWINQALFQASWPACVIGAGQGTLLPGLIVVGAFAFWQLSPKRSHPNDVRAVLLFVALGAILDTLWQRVGVVEYALAWPAPGYAPTWLLLLWVAMALTVNHSLGVFRRRWDLFVLIASIGSPMSYAAGAAFGAVTWTAPSWIVVLCLGPGWALLVGLAFRHFGRGGRAGRGGSRSLEAARG